MEMETKDNVEPVAKQSATNLPQTDKEQPQAKEANGIKMKSTSFSNDGPLVKGGPVIVTIDDVLYYNDNIDDFKELKEEDVLAPFIVYLNSRFKKVANRRKQGRLLKSIFYIISIIIFGIGLTVGGYFLVTWLIKNLR